jgi:quercetin dioxygenase-like cupin family protein
VPIEIRRFGVGHRRPDGPPGTTGIEGQVIESGPHGVVAELVFGRHARITPHTNPNRTWFVVIEGGGWVGVGDERGRVQAGDAVLWPPDVLHAVWTDGTQMRALVVELPGPTLALPSVVDGSAAAVAEVGSGSPRPASRGAGSLRPRSIDPARHLAGADADDGEPV